MTGHLLALVTRRWALRVPRVALLRSTVPGVASSASTLRGTRRARRSVSPAYSSTTSAGPGPATTGAPASGEDVIQRIGGWKTASMFKRYNIVDERDLADAGERLSAFLTNAAGASPTIVPLAAARAARADRTRTEHGQSGDLGGCASEPRHRKVLNFHCAEVAELADAGDSKSPARKGLGVRFPSSASDKSRS